MSISEVFRSSEALWAIWAHIGRYCGRFDLYTLTDATHTYVTEEIIHMALWVPWIKPLELIYGLPLLHLLSLGYFVQGFRCFPWFAVNFFLKDALSVDPWTLQIVQSSVNLPMVAKPLYGIISDTIYIKGAHRVPYLGLGGKTKGILHLF